MTMKRLLFSLLLSISTIAIIAAACIANYFCSTLSLNSYSTKSGVISAKEECFLVCINKSQNQLEAETIADDYSDASCTGYVYKNGEYFYVVHSAYNKQNDAYLVSEHLKKLGMQTEILNLSFPSIIVNEEFSQEHHNLLLQTLSSFFSSFRSLSDMAVGISTNVYSTEQITDKLLKLCTKLENLQKTYSLTFETGSPCTISIGQYLADEVECVMMTKPVERDINSRAIELVEIYQNMCEELS